MSQNHTPGPWEVRKSSSAYDICLPVEAGARGVAVIATVFSEADANPIAALPDLLAALEEALIKQENDRTLWTPEWQIWASDARAAISKAKASSS